MDDRQATLPFLVSSSCFLRRHSPLPPFPVALHWITFWQIFLQANLCLQHTLALQAKIPRVCFLGKGKASRRYQAGIKSRVCAGSATTVGKAGICLSQLSAKGSKIIMALLLILLVPGPSKVILVVAASREVHGAAYDSVCAPHLHPSLRSHKPSSTQLSLQFYSSLHSFLCLAQDTSSNFV